MKAFICCRETGEYSDHQKEELFWTTSQAAAEAWQKKWQDEAERLRREEDEIEERFRPYDIYGETPEAAEYRQMRRRLRHQFDDGATHSIGSLHYTIQEAEPLPPEFG